MEHIAQLSKQSSTNNEFYLRKLKHGLLERALRFTLTPEFKAPFLNFITTELLQQLKTVFQNMFPIPPKS